MIKNTFSVRDSLLIVLLFALSLFLFACGGANDVVNNSHSADEENIEGTGEMNGDEETIDLNDLFGDNDDELELDEELEKEKGNLLIPMEFRRNTQSRFVDHIETFGFERNDGVKVSIEFGEGGHEATLTYNDGSNEEIYEIFININGFLDGDVIDQDGNTFDIFDDRHDRVNQIYIEELLVPFVTFDRAIRDQYFLDEPTHTIEEGTLGDYDVYIHELSGTISSQVDGKDDYDVSVTVATFDGFEIILAADMYDPETEQQIKHTYDITELKVVEQ